MNNRSHIEPPKLANRFLEWYCNEQLKETIQGDLYEEFQINVQQKGRFKAQLIYWKHVILFINRYTLKRDKSHYYQSSTSGAMLRNFALIAIRNLKKNLAFSTINISGLAIGLASCMIIFFFVNKELSFDNFHSDKDHIYRVTNIYERASGTINWARTPPALAPAIRTSLQEVERVAQLRLADDHSYTVGDRVFTEKNAFYADSSFLDIFDFELLSGDRSTVLDAPNSIAISRDMAFKYFGEIDPVGKSILLDNERSLLVTGVFENIPSNSHIYFDFLISFSSYIVPDGYLADLTSWAWAGFWTYIQVTPNADVESVRNQIRELYNRDERSSNRTINIELQQLEDLYLESSKYTRMGGSIRVGSSSTIYTLIGIAALILLLAGFNFMNLSTAISLNRGKEIGVRKVLGAVKQKITTQFLIESILIAMISLCFSLILVWFAKPYASYFLEIELPDRIIEYLRFLPVFLITTIFFGVIAGAYPSLVLSKFKPVQALKGTLKTSTSGQLLTKTLMVVQFAVSIGLITISMVIVSQMNFIKNKGLGFEQEYVLRAQVQSSVIRTQYDVIKDQFIQHPRILNLSQSTGAFDGYSGSGGALLDGQLAEDARQLSYYQTTHEFLDVMNIELLEGRFFSPDRPNDRETAMVLNETAVADLELENPIGTRIRFNDRDREVIGVVRDFNISSLHTPIAPMAIVMPFAELDQFLIKASPGPADEVLAAVRATWKNIAGVSPINITFLDEEIQLMYDREQRLSNIIYVFSALAILLGCLGLYGLVAFTIHARLKEVGIRKVLGAHTGQILFGLSKQFVTLILMANIIAWPVTYYFADLWLSGFAYRIHLEWWMFVLSGVSLLVIALFTISNQTIKAALTNPIKVLKTE